MTTNAQVAMIAAAIAVGYCEDTTDLAWVLAKELDEMDTRRDVRSVLG